MCSVNFNKLQHVQNTLTRVVLKRQKFYQIILSLVELHWLPICQRTTFKLATMPYIPVNHIICQTPEFFYWPEHNLRSSSDHKLLTVTRTWTVTASRGFKHPEVSVWNSLPFDIRDSDSMFSFKRQLKTFICYIWRVIKVLNWIKYEWRVHDQSIIFHDLFDVKVLWH